MRAKAVPENPPEAPQSPIPLPEQPGMYAGYSTIEIRKGFKDSNQVDHESTDAEIISVRQFFAPHTEVNLSMGLTINLGNYESARIDVGIRVPCYLEEASEAYEFSKKFATERLTVERTKIKSWADSRTKKDLF